MTIFYFTLIRSFRNKFTLIALCALPLIMIFIRPLWLSDGNLGFMLYSLVIMYASFLLIRSITTDRQVGTITRILAAPINTFKYLWQSLLAYALLLIVQIFIILPLGALLYHWTFSLTLKLILCYTVFAAASISFSLAWNTLFRDKAISDALFSIVVSFMSILGGIFIPINALPSLLQKIGALLPTYWLAVALSFLSENSNPQPYWLAIAMLLLFTTSFLIFGSKIKTNK